MDLAVDRIDTPPVAERSVEIVERKGLGHPDSICDALAEQVSVALSRFYREHCGLILHHNVDKALLCGGAARPAFGGGDVLAPIVVYLAGRATHEFRGVRVPVDELAVDACRRWLRGNLRHLDPERHVEIRPLIRPGSPDLVELFLRQQKTDVALANDTSCGVGYAPLSDLETVVQRVERGLNAAECKRTHPQIGEDVKVMGVRRGEAIRLTVACAFVGRHLPDLEAYVKHRSQVAQLAGELARAATGREVEVAVNAADDESSESVYLTVTGTSAESGDDGEAGRGNRTNGLITPGRPMTMESVAGKNPVTHVGKLYNLAAGLAADAIVRECPEASEAECLLVSQIGRPVADPQVVQVRVRCAADTFADVVPRAEETVRQELARLHTLADDLVEGRIGIDRWPLRE